MEHEDELNNFNEILIIHLILLPGVICASSGAFMCVFDMVVRDIYTVNAWVSLICAPIFIIDEGMKSFIISLINYIFVCITLWFWGDIGQGVFITGILFSLLYYEIDKHMTEKKCIQGG